MSVRESWELRSHQTLGFSISPHLPLIWLCQARTVQSTVHTQHTLNLHAIKSDPHLNISILVARDIYATSLCTTPTDSPSGSRYSAYGVTRPTSCTGRLSSHSTLNPPAAAHTERGHQPDHLFVSRERSHAHPRSSRRCDSSAALKRLENRAHVRNMCLWTQSSRSTTLYEPSGPYAASNMLSLSSTYHCLRRSGMKLNLR